MPRRIEVKAIFFDSTNQYRGNSSLPGPKKKKNKILCASFREYVVNPYRVIDEILISTHPAFVLHINSVPISITTVTHDLQ